MVTLLLLIPTLSGLSMGDMSNDEILSVYSWMNLLGGKSECKGDIHQCICFKYIAVYHM